MDISFDIKNTTGDHIMVALSYYDAESISVFSSDPQILTLEFYDVTLVRKTGSNFVGYNVLAAVTDVLGRFMEENEGAVLCFYCDADTDVRRSHLELFPQEYRSRLFTRLFELYARSHKYCSLINHVVEIEDTYKTDKRQFAHFICRKEHEEAVISLGRMLMEK